MKHGEPECAAMPRLGGDAIAGSGVGTAPGVGSATRDRLADFAALVVRWNRTIKLVSTPDTPHLWARHIDDALQLVPHIPPAATHGVDLGSGGGFPGLVLALATGMHFDLIESDSRKAAFRQEAARMMKAPVTVHGSRIENTALQPRSLVTARARAPLPKLLGLSQPFLAEGGVCLFPKGERADSEIADACKAWVMDLKQLPSRTSPAGRILRITNLRRRETESS